MTVEQATEEMNQAVEALKLAQQHLLEAAAEATQNLSDIKRILGMETPALKIAPAVKKPLPQPVKDSNGKAGRPGKSAEDLKNELAELEALEAPTKQQTARKAQVRWLLKRKEVLDPPAAPQEEAEPPSSPLDLLEPQEEKYKILIHEKGLWRISKIVSGKKAAEEELTRLTYEGQEARMKRL